MTKYTLFFLFSLFTLFFCQAGEPPKTEVRAVWLTTIYGLDWPGTAGTKATDMKMQQQEVCTLLDRLEEANFNMVFVQVRVRGDVIYRSKIEPASKVFSGKYGVMPAYDPLSFVIDACHKRGMECHAWFVTFPVGNERIVREQGKLSVVRRHPKLVKRHKGEWYLDPGQPETADYLLSLVKELVSGYDIDGIHFDYIRYPEQAKSFPDKSLHAKYGQRKSLTEWRRENINRLVSRLYDQVKHLKPWVQVSSSPLGKYNRIERMPDAGWTAYESVFQDPKQWMQQGKQDMVVPMMYYLHDNFFPFVDNWVDNSNGRLFVPGLGAYRLEQKEGDWSLNDITDQIDYARASGGAGCAFFRCMHVLDDSKGLYNELKNTYYKYPAQLPALTWLNDRVPDAPEEIYVERQQDHLKLTWSKPDTETEDLTYTIYYSLTDAIDTASAQHILITGVRDTTLYLPITPGMERGYLFSVSASTRYHIESTTSRETYYYQSEYTK